MNISDPFPGTLVQKFLQGIHLGKELLNQRRMNIQLLRDNVILFSKVVVVLYTSITNK